MADPARTDPPPVGEEIHLPEGTALPFVMAIAITLVLVGVTLTPVFSVAGVLLFLYVLRRWISDVRHEIDELPVDHH